MSANVLEPLPTSRIDRVLPTPGPVQVSSLVSDMAVAESLRPFNDETMAFCVDFSKALGRASRGLPEAQALAFWMRKTELVRLRKAFESLADDRTVLVPRGLVFHIPPSNVDTMFVYSWLMSTLTGNRNIVRLSSRATDQSNLVLDVLRDQMDSYPKVQESTAMVTYAHDKNVTDTLSGACDMRVVWGGDSTVQAVRESPIQPHATELTFPDRFSFTAIKTDAYLAGDSSARDQLVERFFSDSYFFDQLGCSSSRLLVWVGDESGASESSSDFFRRLGEVIESRDYSVDTATSIAKLGYGMRAIIEQPVTGYETHGNALTVLPVSEFPKSLADYCGAGLFYEFRTDTLRGIIEHIERKDQTLSYFGFSVLELHELAEELNGSGIDRMVPVGQALTFNRVWDGNDLLQSFTRRVTIEPESNAS